MKIIGEKINGTLSKVRAAIEKRDVEYIQQLAASQIEAGVDWLDVNAGTSPERELEDLLWLIQCVQEVADVPLCLDSANPEPLAEAVHAADKTPIINSISLEKQKVEKILPVVKDNDCDVIALAMDDDGIPQNTEERLKIIDRLLEVTESVGIPAEKVYIDPLVMAAATNTESGNIALSTIKKTAEKYPTVHFCAGLSNISFGLPHRIVSSAATAIVSVTRKLQKKALLDNGSYHSIVVGCINPWK